MSTFPRTYIFVTTLSWHTQFTCGWGWGMCCISKGCWLLFGRCRVVLISRSIGSFSSTPVTITTSFCCERRFWWTERARRSNLSMKEDTMAHLWRSAVQVAPALRSSGGSKTQFHRYCIGTGFTTSTRSIMNSPRSSILSLPPNHVWENFSLRWERWNQRWRHSFTICCHVI